jgi:hypothetical protein
MSITINIRHCLTNEVLYTHTADHNSICTTLLAAVADGVDLSEVQLIYANLLGVDLSGLNLSKANLNGAYLRKANLAGANLSKANLSGANLREADLRKADLSKANLRGVSFSDANLSGANLSEANLNQVTFFRALLTGAQLDNPPIVPDLDGQILRLVEANPAALNMDNWHTCRTTHCRAGWAIVLAGPAGAALQAQWGPATAGALIYAASYPNLTIPHFLDSHHEALTDIRVRAALA